MKVIYTLVCRSTTSQRLHNLQQPKSRLFTVQCSCYPLRRTPFSNYVCMRIGSLVQRPQITAFWLRTRLACSNMNIYVIWVASLCLVPGLRTSCWQHIGKMLLTTRLNIMHAIKLHRQALTAYRPSMMSSFQTSLCLTGYTKNVLQAFES